MAGHWSRLATAPEMLQVMMQGSLTLIVPSFQADGRVGRRARALAVASELARPSHPGGGAATRPGKNRPHADRPHQRTCVEHERSEPDLETGNSEPGTGNSNRHHPMFLPRPLDPL